MNFNFNIELGSKIVHPSINYETVLGCLSENWDELERLITWV